MLKLYKTGGCFLYSIHFAGKRAKIFRQIAQINTGKIWGHPHKRNGDSYV